MILRCFGHCLQLMEQVSILLFIIQLLSGPKQPNETDGPEEMYVILA